jgi:hypothetical protein
VASCCQSMGSVQTLQQTVHLHVKLADLSVPVHWRPYPAEARFRSVGFRPCSDLQPHSDTLVPGSPCCWGPGSEALRLANRVRLCTSCSSR